MAALLWEDSERVFHRGWRLDDAPGAAPCCSLLLLRPPVSFDPRSPHTRIRAERRTRWHVGSAAIGARARSQSNRVGARRCGRRADRDVARRAHGHGALLAPRQKTRSADGLPESAVPPIADVLLLQRNDAKGRQRTFVFTDPAARARPDEEAQFHIAE